MPSLRRDDDFEILDITGSNKNWIQKTFKDISKQSMAKQLAIGGAGGWCSGYVCGKVGKAAAAALGGSLLLIQIAQHQGYITINWSKLENSMKKARKEIERNSKQTNFSAMAEEVQEFMKENMFVAGGFAAGFLLGLAS